jgi:hypothetical protein
MIILIVFNLVYSIMIKADGSWIIHASYDFWKRNSARRSTGSFGIILETSRRPMLRVGTTNYIK